MQKMETISKNPIKTNNSTTSSQMSPTTRLSDTQAGSAEISLDHIAPERRRVWVEKLTESLTFLGREVPQGNRLKMAIRSFDKLCEEIPTRVLADVFDLSLNFTEDNGSSPFWDGRLLLRVWTLNRATLREKLSSGLLATTPRVNCPDCLGNSLGRKYRRDEYGRPRELSPDFCTHENDPGDLEQISEEDFLIELPECELCGETTPEKCPHFGTIEEVN